jgi:hypothetical protein
MDSGRYIGDYRQPDRDEGDLDGTEVGKLREEDRWSFSPSCCRLSAFSLFSYLQDRFLVAHTA